MAKTDFTRKVLVFAFAMSFLLLSAQLFGQSASLSGTVMDVSQGVLPGASVMATNNGTGVKTTAVTNSAGIYNFPALPPGTYTVTVELTGFQTNTKTDVQLGSRAQIRMNFELAVAGVSTQIEISTSAQDLLLESSSSTGTVMTEKVAKELPLLGNDMLQLVNVMGGVVKQENTIFGNSNQTFAGVLGGDINITRDGISVNDARFSSGIVSPGRLNPEMVAEFRMVLTPVDAEMGRGAGQVQVLTRSGGNEFHGSGVWSILNTALDANEWNNNRTGQTQDWKNVNQYILSGGGPIIKNRTFFFASWDHTIVRERKVVIPKVLTPCARKGIYRWFPGWVNGNADATINRSLGAQTRPVVNSSGTPLTPADNRDGTAYTNLYTGDPTKAITPSGMAFASVLGQLTPQAISQISQDPDDCSAYDFSPANTGVISGTNWDPNRKAYDTSGYIDGFSSIMPMPNYYAVGDGLNVAALRWTRTTKGADTVFGTGQDSHRKAITLRIDHNINQAHRLSGTYSYEKALNDAGEALWPENSYGGFTERKPQTFTSSLTSTLKPTLLNEFRFGLAYNTSHNGAPFDNPTSGEKLKELLQTLLPTSDFPNWSGLPLLLAPGSGIARFQPEAANNGSHPIGGRNVVEATWGAEDYRWTFTDSVTWTRGSHSFKFGGDIRLTKANSDMNGWAQFGDISMNWNPAIYGGNTVNSQPQGLTAGAAFLPGLVGQDSGNGATGNYVQAYDLMNYMTGSIAAIRQFYFVNDPKSSSWSDPATAAGQSRKLKMNQREFSFFVKDDWKVTSDLTLNLGIRYEYYGVPWMLNGMTVGLEGGASSAFGGSEGGFSSWMSANPQFNSNKVTRQIFIGPGTTNPDQRLFNKDLNNFGPAVGFSWQLPWFGKGKTTLRGGYQVSYTQISRMDPNAGFMNVAGSQPGLLYPHTFTGDNINYPYLDISMLKDLVPTSQFHDANVQPLQFRPITDRTQSIAVYDPNIRSPYIQSLTMALTRQMGSNLTLDVRYIGTLSRKQVMAINLNAPNWINNGLRDALDLARAGGESALLNQMIPANALVNGVTSGAAQVRASGSTSRNLALGNYNPIATFLATTNGRIAAGPGVNGNLLRSSGFPENFIYTNPQFAAANMWGNHLHSNYHSLQGQVTLRPTHGLNFQATYTWSRNLGVFGAPTDPLDMAADYGILSNHRSHMLQTYGAYNLPLGPSGYLFRNATGFIKKAAEGWQLSWVGSVTSGLPASVTTVESMYARGMPDLVRPDLWDPKAGDFTFDPANRGRFFGSKYVRVNDPQCAGVAASLQATCNANLGALALAADPTAIIFKHPKPGVRGNYLPNQITGPGRWSLDMAMSKNFEFLDGRSINFRADVTNIFNHPTPSGGLPATYNARDYELSNPNFNLNSLDPFGYIGYKGGHRVFSAKVRVTF